MCTTDLWLQKAGVQSLSVLLKNRRVHVCMCSNHYLSPGGKLTTVFQLYTRMSPFCLLACCCFHRQAGKLFSFYFFFFSFLFVSFGWVWFVFVTEDMWTTVFQLLSVNRRPFSVGQIFAIYHLIGLVVRRSPREWKVPGLNPACARIFSRSSHTSDLNIGTPVATLPGAWRYRVSAGTGWPGVSILGLGEMESLICNFYLSVAARKIV